ncbi:MAG: MATE family efflux transporter [Blautia sp.]|nr:MATE family efflux transporter [Blautia sp.]MDD7372187.1 MATE family efflux transporter [Bacillota bacterium]MDY3714458.1 MATE family efflux transporter [Blautia sp.]
MPQSNVQENKMGVLPVPKLLFQMSLPMILSMLVQALYNIVDSIFVAQINENALTAVSLVFPVQNLLIAIAVGTGVGVNSVLSRSLGAKEFRTANACAQHGIFLAFISGILFAIAGNLLAVPFFNIQTSDVQIKEYGVTYMTIISTLCVAVYLQVMFERLLQSTGRTFFTMISQGVGAIINIIMDPILIFGLLGFPKLGVAGAAIATVFGQACACVLGLFFNIKVNKDISIDMRHFRPDKKIIASIYEVGIPSIVMQAIGSLMTFGMNKILIQFTSTATAVFGVYFKLNSFIFMPVFGLNNGMVPIVAYNYGARNKKRITQTIHLSIISAVVIMLCGLALFMIFPENLLRMFNASDAMLEIGVPALRIICLSFIFAGFCIVVGSVFQALGNGIYSLIVSAARQLLVILPVAAFLAKVGGLSAVWWAIPIAEIASVTFSSYFYRKIYKEKIAPLGD